MCGEDNFAIRGIIIAPVFVKMVRWFFLRALSGPMEVSRELRCSWSTSKVF